MNVVSKNEARRRVRLCASEEIGEGAVLAVKLSAIEPIALYRAGGKLFATQATCTHAKASLADGWLDGFTIGCPVHAGEFDIRTGAPLCFPVTVALRTFPIWEEKGEAIADLTGANAAAEVA